MTNHTIAVILGVYWIVQVLLIAADDQPKARRTNAWFIRCALGLAALPLYALLICRLAF